MRVLLISNTPWARDNSFGNSFSNIFEGIEGLEFANIYCRTGLPNNKINGKYFQITEKTLIKNLFNKKSPSGHIVIDNDQSIQTNTEKKIWDHARKSRLQIYFWIRDLIWKIGRWRSYTLIEFIDNFQPDIIFQPLYYSNYLNDIVLFIKKHTNVPMVCYVSDDVYTLRQFSLSPLYWLDRLIKRRKIKKVVELCEYLYVISDIQKKEYEKCFRKECKVLTKGYDFCSPPPLKFNTSLPLKFVYTGNLGSGRWKTLALVGRGLKEINRYGLKAQLYIYTTTPLTRRMKKALIIEESVLFKGGVPSDRIARIQSNADVLVHVEPLNMKGRLQVRHSFSTKLVDYFYAGRAILAVGPLCAASIDYLRKNDAAIVATNLSEIYERLFEISKNSNLLKNYAQKAWDCGRRNHQIKDIQNRLYNDLKALL